MRIEEDLKLGFKDVLIRPKRSTLKSRSDVELERQFTFKHSGQTWSGVPIIAANMDTVGTFEMAQALAGFDILTAVHKHYTVEEWAAFINTASADVLKHVMVSTGTSDADFEKTVQILALNPALNFVCIDVANGYSEHFVQFVAKAREAWPTKNNLRRQCGNGRDVRRAYPLRRRYRESGNWSRLRMHDACKNWRWLSATVGGYRMR